MKSSIAQRARYLLPENETTARIEALFAAGIEAWTNRAVARLDERFAWGQAGETALVATCQRLEKAFRKGGDETVHLKRWEGGMTDEEFSDWVRFGDAYARAREAAFRVMFAEPAPGTAPPRDRP